MKEATDPVAAGAASDRPTRAMMERDLASAALGMVVEHDEAGHSVVSLVVRDDMTNGFRITHGGIVFALADTAWADVVSPPSPGSPPWHRRPTPESPAPDGPIMAKFPRAAGPDPGQGVEPPFHYHTEAPDPAAAPAADERPPEESVLWKRVRRNLLFWQAATDVVQVSVFGPPAVTPGEPARVTTGSRPGLR